MKQPQKVDFITQEQEQPKKLNQFNDFLIDQEKKITN
jgi:uncharacterized phage-like protein YoqJ